jgi:hypothetical protein
MKPEYLWALVTLIIAIALAIILLNLVKDDVQSKVQVDCMDPVERERIREIVLNSVDKGLETQVAHLFEVWMKDLTDQPRRALVGTNTAVNAHVRARKNALAWDPPTCESNG